MAKVMISELDIEVITVATENHGLMVVHQREISVRAMQSLSETGHKDTRYQKNTMLGDGVPEETVANEFLMTMGRTVRNLEGEETTLAKMDTAAH